MLSLNEICKITEARALHLDANLSISKIDRDSRLCGTGSLFVALIGPTSDGHDFCAAAVKAGATAIIVSREIPGLAVTQLIVADTLTAYRRLASAWRRAATYCKVISVAGSVGKTTCKELIATIMSSAYAGKVISTVGSQNGFEGIPDTLLRIRSDTKVAIIEIGIDGPSAMKQHMAMVSPDISMLTAITPEHIEGFGSFEVVIREELIALSACIRSGGIAMINLNDEHMASAYPFVSSDTSNEKLWYFELVDQLPSTFALRRLQGQYDSRRQELSLNIAEGRTLTLPLPSPGEHNARNTLGCLGVARAMGVAFETAIAALKNFVAPFGRSQLRTTTGGASLICDYYNASPESVAAGIKTLRDLAKGRNMWVVLGDMLELGPSEHAFHRQIAPQIIDAHITGVIAYGPRMKHLVDELKTLGFGGYLRHCETTSEITPLIADLNASTIILAKASRGMQLEHAFESILP